MLTEIRETQRHHDCLNDLQRYIRRHLDEPLHRDVLASVSGFSVPHLHRIFAESTGESIACYVRHVRLERAARKLIMGAVDITEIALAAGYSSHAAFGKAFKQRYALSPREFRQLNCFDALKMLRKG